MTREDFGSGEEFLSWGSDRSEIQNANFSILIFPVSTTEVASILAYCFKNKLAVVPSGGRTGLAGGAIAANGEIVINLSKINSLVLLNKDKQYIQAGAGMITAVANDHAKSIGYNFPIDLAASGSSCIGGNVATHAGGIRVIRYGLLRDYVSGMTVVSGTGEVLEFYEDVLKNNTGYHMMPLFIGSEGTLGIITELRINLVREPKETVVCLLSVKDIPGAIRSLQNLYANEIVVLGYEYFDRTSYDLSRKHMDLQNIFEKSSRHFVLLEIESINTINENLTRWMELEIEEGRILDGKISMSSSQKKDFWAYREAISESISLKYKPVKNDISIPIDSIDEFIKKIYQFLEKKKLNISCCVFGHLGDGNLHINLLNSKGIKDEEFKKQSDEVTMFIFSQLKKVNGSISAEHGIGLLKKEYLNYSRSRAQIEIMKKIKQVFDPEGILNPGKVF